MAATHLCSSLRMCTLKLRGVTTLASTSAGKASAGGTHMLNSDSQFCSVFTWNSNNGKQRGGCEGQFKLVESMMPADPYNVA